MYNSKDYWNKRPNPNKTNLMAKYEAEAIRKFVKKGNILDFGCGIGRTFPLYSGKVTGVDFSEIYKDRAIEAANHLEYTHIIHNVHESSLPFKYKEFTQGLAIKVLLHAPDHEAETIIKELGRVCEEVLIISFNSDKTTASHCFSRDYNKFITDLGFEVVSCEHNIEDNIEQDIIIYR